MVDGDSMGPVLELVGARFCNFLSGSYHASSNVAECRYHTDFKWPHSRTAGGYGHTVGHAGCPIHTAHTDVILTWSKVKVMVTDLLKLRELHFSTSTSSLFWSGAQLMDDYDMGPSLQLFGARFLNFSPSWRSRGFQVRKMFISPDSIAFYLRAACG